MSARLPRAWTLAAAFGLLVCGIGLGLGAALRPAVAQGLDESAAGTYITPFPGSERYRMAVIGDGLAEGIHEAFTESLGSDPRVDLERRHWWLSGLARPDFAEEMRDLGRTVAGGKLNIAVVVTGTLDRWSYRAPNGRRLSVGSPEWREVYGGRIDELIKVLKGAGAAVYWVGLPIMRRGDANEAGQAINEIIRERAYINGIRFVDVYQGFAGEDGNYNPYGPDVAGKIRLLRERDGIHMTPEGYAKLAHFVEREVKRDLAQAKNERAVPLAGNEAEQALVNPGGAQAAGGTGGGWTSTTNGTAGESDGSGDQKAEIGRVNLKTIGADGRDEVIAIDIVRPAIPAAVILAVTKRESADRASQMGDQILEQIPGGLTVMSSITPSGAAGTAGGTARRKVSPAQTPYFRVLVKGERIAQREGRADDASWPRPPPEAALPPRAAPASRSSDEVGVPLPVPKPFRR
ncbi:MAG: DUF459 domain-containing protein [Hyphomicrobiaceae bacterium]|nr:DUF459 domain-containing protein [Hyphomicrobiaceae bacterium]